MLVQPHQDEPRRVKPPRQDRGWRTMWTGGSRAPRGLGPAEEMPLDVGKDPTRAVMREDAEVARAASPCHRVVRGTPIRAQGEEDRRGGGLFRGGEEVDDPQGRARDRLDDQQVVTVSQ